MSIARPTRTVLLTLVTALCALLALPAAGVARSHKRHHHRHRHKVHIDVGIGDQNSAMFSAPAYRKLRIRKVRYTVPWDIMRHRNRDELAAADTWVEDARAAHARPLIHVTTNKYVVGLHPVGNHKYKKLVGRLVRHFRHRGVREFGAWNEENHAKEPTSRHPGAAARYFRDMWHMCHHRGHRRCTVVALDVLDQRGVRRYIHRFYRDLSHKWRRRADIVGIHNYSDTNRKYHHGSGTRAIIQATQHYDAKADFWLTETGGLVAFGGDWPCNKHRAANRIRYTFRLARKFRDDISRLYFYNWTGSDCQGFDSGLTNADGSLRPGYYAFKHAARHFTR